MVVINGNNLLREPNNRTIDKAKNDIWNGKASLMNKGSITVAVWKTEKSVVDGYASRIDYLKDKGWRIQHPVPSLKTIKN